MSVTIQQGSNPYQENVQGKANEPITVAGLLDRAEALLDGVSLGHTLFEIYDRLEANAPRIAVIGGSADHPAHIHDTGTVLRAAARIWQSGGVPFSFAIPVVCDATAQSNIGMGYSLQSRNAVAGMVVNQVDAHSYHGAFVVSGCDKTPLGIVSGLAHLDRIRRERGDAPLFATFAPAHVLRGGTIPSDLMRDLEAIAQRAEEQGDSQIAFDVREASKYVLQCISNSAYQGVLTRARHEGLLTLDEHKGLERRLAVHTCHHDGGICAFNGTGNSSRNVVTGLGLTHPAVELLTAPPEMEQVNRAVDALFTFVNNPEYSVGSIVGRNFSNAVRIHSATGGSTNLMMHLVAAMIYAGYDVDVWHIDHIRRHPPVPDIFDYSLSEDRDLFSLARQVCAGQIRGMETVFYELLQHGVPMDVDAPTVTGTTWRERLADERSLAAASIADNPIILATPRRAQSGIEVLKSNFFETAVVKISGMTDAQLGQFDDQIDVVLYYENEEDANQSLLDTHVLDRLATQPTLTREKLLGIAAHNSQGSAADDLQALDKEALLQHGITNEWLKIMVVISGQGPEAFGMPEMFTPMRHINANRSLHRLAALISDGRYSGTTWGAAIGHVTPEAINDGGICYLETGDLVHVQLTERRIDLLDPDAFSQGEIVPWQVDLGALRHELGQARQERIGQRRRQIAATNRLIGVTDASKGVVPGAVAEEATLPYTK